MAKRLSYCGDQVARQDRDRFLCTLFAPDDRLEALWALLAFNIEIARTREVISEPLLGEMRVQWWRDVVAALYGEGTAPRGNQVLDRLADVVRDYDLPRAPFDRLLDARTAEVTSSPPVDVEAFVAHGAETDGALNELLLHILDPDAPQDAVEAARATGAAWSVAGRLRAIPFHARKGWITLPSSVATAESAVGADILGGRASAALVEAVKKLVQEARTHIAEARRYSYPAPRLWQGVTLQARLAELYLDRLERLGHNPFDEKLERGRAGRQLRLWLSAKREAYSRGRSHRARRDRSGPPNRST